jgi:general secretion pathway protein G
MKNTSTLSQGKSSPGWRAGARMPHGNSVICFGGRRGFSLLELLVVMVIVGILMAIAVPTFSYMKDRAKNYTCFGEIRTVEKDIISYQVDMGVPPNSLNDLGRGVLLDPWKRPYQYQKLAGGIGTPYEDPLGDPLNTDFDLFSLGKDGISTQSLTLGNSSTEDDIIRGSDGLYVGFGTDF